jgi:UDPglucose 6-dehydrogenase
MQIAMIGLGKLGLPVAEVMAQQHTVRGYDINPNIQSDHIWIADSTSAACQDADIVFVAVPTPHDARYGGETPSSHLPVKDFDYQYLESALESVKASAPPEALIVNISTVLPGTLRPMIHALGIQDRFCYNPYLIAMGTVKDDFTHPDIMMLGFDEWPTDEHRRQADLLIDFYSSIQHANKHITVGTWEECECIKIFHNTYISAKVVIANMIQDVTQRIGHANPSTIAESLRHADRIVSGKYMEPGMGDGGPCHPRDNIALSWLAHELNLGYDLFHDIMQSREQQARLVAESLVAYDLPIHIIGRSFKPGTDLTDGSTAELVAHYCTVEWDQPVEFDSVSRQPAVYLLAHDRDYSDLSFAQGSVIVDMYRRFLRDSEGVEVVWYGVKPPAPPQ